MNETRLNLIGRLAALPTAPYREDAVGGFIDDFCRRRRLPVKKDGFGNRMVAYGKQYPGPALAFAAHMDHPGFIIESDSVRSSASARFYGGVEEKYFDDARVRVFTPAGPVRAVVKQTRFDKTDQVRHVRLRTEGPVFRGNLAMWDLPPFRVRSGRIYSRACDDLIGCASILCLLDELCRRRIQRKAVAVFSAAEEAGLHGAKALCAAKALPKSTIVISIETSSVLPGVNMGEGAVIRVGDKSRVFDPAVTDFLLDCAQRARSKNPELKYQRKLMDAGTCEASVYQRFGYPVGALCVPLGNYHNRNTRTGRIAPEFVSVPDLDAMIELFLTAVKNAPRIDAFFKRTPPRYKTQTRDLGEFFLKSKA
jgi:putative aminopeptidase FrvX